MQPLIEFDPATHTYKVGGQVVLSVTQVLDANGLYPAFGKSEIAARFGTIGHTTIKMMFDGTLVGYSPSFEPWMGGIRKFFDEQKPEPTGYEKILVSKSCCGTVDFIGKIASMPRMGRYMSGRYCLLDWKFWSSANKTLLRLAGFQTAGYEDLHIGENGKQREKAHRGVVHFQENGEYAIYWLKDPADSLYFQSLLNVAKLKIAMEIHNISQRGWDEQSRD